jgi:trehalose/maltose hydrolase-like predicted phosphorylase
MTIKKISAVILLSGLLLNSCTKKATPTPPPPPPTEENIAFSIEPDPGSSTVTSTTATYPYTVKLTSKIPANGIHVDYATQLDTDNSNPTFTRESSSSATSYSLTTANLESGKLYKVTVVVTSQKTSTNALSKTFRVARK